MSSNHGVGTRPTYYHFKALCLYATPLCLSHHELGDGVEEPLDLGVGGGLSEEEVSVALEDHVLQRREQLLVDPDADLSRIHLDA